MITITHLYTKLFLKYYNLNKPQGYRAFGTNDGFLLYIFLFELPSECWQMKISIYGVITGSHDLHSGD